MENHQKIRKHYPSDMELAMRYYAVIAAVNGFKLSNKELEFLGYLATKKGEFVKKEYSIKYDTPDTAINTLVYFLRKKGILLKDRRLTIHPDINKLDFSAPITLTLNLSVNETS